MYVRVLYMYSATRLTRECRSSGVHLGRGGKLKRKKKTVISSTEGEEGTCKASAYPTASNGRSLEINKSFASSLSFPFLV